MDIENHLVVATGDLQPQTRSFFQSVQYSGMSFAHFVRIIVMGQ